VRNGTWDARVEWVSELIEQALVRKREPLAGEDVGPKEP